MSTSTSDPGPRPASPGPASSAPAARPAARPRRRRALVAGVAVVVLLTGLGVRLLLAGAEAFGPARLVFGTSFVASDLALYALGVVAATTADLLVSRARR